MIYAWLAVVLGYTVICVDSILHLEGRWVCHYPCQCPVRELNCVPGIPIVKDGCGCCYMCARQHGDTCSVKDVCDVTRGFYCDMTSGKAPGTGICKASSSKPCVVNGVSYSDGEKFQPECSRTCTCQNGKYGCVDLCPDEYRTPSSTHCKSARLIAVPDQCCKQWVCGDEEVPDNSTHTDPALGASSGDPGVASGGTSGSDVGGGISPRHISQHKMDELQMQSLTREEPVQENSAVACAAREKSAWSECTSTCDVGVSRRTTVDRECNEKAEVRLCYLRPCYMDVPGKSERCTATTKTKFKRRMRYEDCVSMREWRFKFCSTCKQRRCCYPIRHKTRAMTFQCSSTRRETFDVMWIQRCRCDRECYKKDKRKKKSRASRRRSRKYRQP